MTVKEMVVVFLDCIMTILLLIVTLIVRFYFNTTSLIRDGLTSADTSY